MRRSWQSITTSASSSSLFYSRTRGFRHFSRNHFAVANDATAVAAADGANAAADDDDDDDATPRRRIAPHPPAACRLGSSFLMLRAHPQQQLSAREAFCRSSSMRYFSSAVHNSGNSSSHPMNDTGGRRDDEEEEEASSFSSTLNDDDDDNDDSISSSNSSSSKKYSTPTLSFSSRSSSIPPSPHQALTMLEEEQGHPSLLLEEDHYQQQQQERRRWLLQIVTTSGNFRLLERATRQFDDEELSPHWKWSRNDAECWLLLVSGWARMPPLTTNTATTTTTNAGDLHRQQQQQQQQKKIEKKNQKKKPEQAAVTGAVVAAQLLREWDRRSNVSNASSTTTKDGVVPSLLSPPPLAAFRTVLMALADEGKYKLAAQVLHHLLERSKNHPSLEPDRDCFHRVLQACCHAGAVDEANQWLERMKTEEERMKKEQQHTRKAIHPNISTYKILLQTYVNCHVLYGTRGMGLAAYRMLQEMPIPPDAITYNIVLNALAEEGNYKLAQELFLQLLQQSISGDDDNNNGASLVSSPLSVSAGDGAWSLKDPVPLRTVLKACAQANTVEAGERAEELLREMHAAPCLEARAFTTVIAIWCKLGHPERAKAVLEELLTIYLESTASTTGSFDLRLQPDPFSFRTIIGAFSQKIERLMSPKMDNGHSFSVTSTSSTEHAVELAEQAQHVIIDMHSTMGYAPNLVTCNAVLKCWSLVRQPEAAEDFLAQMWQWNIPPDIVSYNTVIACHAKLGNVQDCTTWLSKLSAAPSSKQGTSGGGAPFPAPNARTVTSVIAALSKQGTTKAAEQAEAWFLQMEDWHSEYGWDCAPNNVSLNALLTCWARVGNGPRAEYILRQFQDYSSNQLDRNGETTAPPNTVSYNMVLQAYGSTNLNKVESLLEELIAVGLQPNDRTVQTVQRALENHRDFSSTTMTTEDKKMKWEEWRQRFFYSMNYAKTTSSGGDKSRRRNKNGKQQQRQGEPQ